MYRLIIVLIMSALMSACGAYEVNSWVIKSSQEFCKDRGGVGLIILTAMGYTHVVCNDGTQKQLLLKDVK